LKDINDQLTEFEVIPSSMLQAPSNYYLGFNSSGTQKDSSLFLTKGDPTVYQPDGNTGAPSGIIEFVPKIEWQIEPLTSPLDSLWSMTGEDKVISSLVRIRSKRMGKNDASYFLTINPTTNQLSVSLDGGGYQSAWKLESITGTNNTFNIRSAYSKLEKPYLSYQFIRKSDNEIYLLRSTVTMSNERCPWILSSLV
jgi:hypothetical protein